MAKSELDILSSAFSSQRLSKYLAYNHDDAERTVTHYKANLHLAESLYISLSVFEVTLRNALSRELRNLAGKDDWWDIFYNTPELTLTVFSRRSLRLIWNLTTLISFYSFKIISNSR